MTNSLNPERYSNQIVSTPQGLGKVIGFEFQKRKIFKDLRFCVVLIFGSNLEFKFKMDEIKLL